MFKSFKDVNVKSFYQENKVTKSIQFDFRATKEGFHNFSDPPIDGVHGGSIITL